MAREMARKDHFSILVFKILLVFFAVLFCAGLVAFVNKLPLYLSWYGPRTPVPYLMNIATILYIASTRMFFLIIIYQLFRLLLNIGKGNPFDPENPRRIRKVAYGAFGIAASSWLLEGIEIFATYLSYNDGNTPLFPLILMFIFRATTMAGFGVGILITAKVLEFGVRLQQDQNLTI